MPVLNTFLGPDRRPIPAVTTDEMREVDRIAIEETGPNLFQMMENAGRNLALEAIDLLGPAWRDAPVVVLAGTGGNGGGGITAARHLANRGADVTVIVTDEQRLGPVPGAQLELFRGTAGTFGTHAALGRVEAALVLDAVIGYSLAGPPRGIALTFIEAANDLSSPVLALDVPSGLDSTSGATPGAAVIAARTMTLALPKPGLVNPIAGDLVLADIGIPGDTYTRLGLPMDEPWFDHRYRIPLTRA